MKFAKEVFGYFIVIIIFSFFLYTAIPEPYYQYITEGFLEGVIFIVISMLSFMGLKKLLGDLVIFIEMKNNTNRRFHKKSFYIKISINYSLGVLIPLFIYFLFSQNNLNDISQNTYTKVLYFILSFLIFKGIIEILLFVKSKTGNKQIIQ